MRIVVLSFLITLGAVACQRADVAEQSARRVEAARAPVEKTGEKVAAAMLARQAQAKQGGSCGGGGSCCGGGASCGGSCGGASCGGGGGEAVAWATVPAGSRWTQLSVTGMKCGGCAKRIERALAKVDGVLGVEIDVTTASVKIATAANTDGRSLAKPAIDALGYRVR